MKNIILNYDRVDDDGTDDSDARPVMTMMTPMPKMPKMPKMTKRTMRTTWPTSAAKAQLPRESGSRPVLEDVMLQECHASKTK